MCDLGFDMGSEMTILEVLNGSTNYLKDHRVENPRLNAELLLARSLNLSRERLYMRLHDQVEERGKEEPRTTASHSCFLRCSIASLMRCTRVTE